ncbi:MAG: hypothetical protein P4N41_05975 [Negativicutes bacterium]|nr:hypothetical protein [Negativicutes bacterium]
MPEDRNECFHHEALILFAGRIEGQLHRIEELLEVIIRELRA